MDSQQSPNPYRQLGKKLKALRDQAKETLAEASVAVEIDVKQLARYELGYARPPEDVLFLLISHFGAADDEALRIWELADYGPSNLPDSSAAKEAIKIDKLIIPIPDARVLFTDVVDVTVNNYGVVMNFMQNAGANSKPISVAKIGMSREHAKSVLEVLQVTLAQTENKTPHLPRKLIAPENSEDKA